MDHASAAARFLDGFARVVGVDRGTLGVPGTVVVGRADRTGTNRSACYWAERRAVIWSDPVLVDRWSELAGLEHAIEPEALAGIAADAGFELLASADMRVLGGRPPSIDLPPGRYRHRRLRASRIDDVELVRAFTARCDPLEVDEAALDDLDHFDELAINVLVDDVDGDGHIVAYASASEWEWDASFGDIGVLVDADHRGRGLGRFVVAEAVRELCAAGRRPLYRHDRANLGSASVARSLGFEPATTLAVYQTTG